ncbi:MAG TPA: dihydrofolate reductase family protein [Polyangia bacterium]|nr:dihydrofolate reductase family protein [Polyangia bacterium]
MRRLSVFNQVSIDGYFASPTGDIGWMHRGDDDPELRAFVAGNASGASVLVFGRKTYQMMASFWPTPLAAEQMPAVAEGMNAAPKLVFSRTLARADWRGTRIVRGDLVAEMRRLKREAGAPLVILGSGSLVGPLVAAGLVDELQVLVAPIVLGAGRTMFGGMDRPIALKLTSTRAFANGKLFNVYEPA